MLENDMKTSKATNQTISRHDYGPAIQGALSWLGNRYLLAEPLNRRSEERKPVASEPPRSQTGSFDAGVMA
jgi:hypothetical protein